MINWQYFPKSDEATQLAKSIVKVFEKADGKIDSDSNELGSDKVLSIICKPLQKLSFEVETGKKKSEKIHVPVLFGLNGSLEKYFEADAYHREAGFVLEVEAGRGVLNNQFLKDLFQACMMKDVYYLGIAVRNQYKTNRDFEKVVKFIDTLYASNRLELPLKGILIVGY